jgi:hypothetical protein
MMHLEDYVQLGEETFVCKFKNLYNIKQVVTQWNINLDTFLKEYNLVNCEANPCVYHNQGTMEIICAIFVDGGILRVVNKQEAHSIFNHL